MSARRRKIVLLAVLAALLLGLAGWAHGRLAAARRGADLAGQNLCVCRALGERIRRLRHRPNLAGAREMQVDVLVRLVERAAGGARIGSGAIERIWPEATRRVGDTVYKEKPTQVVLRNLSMRQLVVFLHALTTETPGLWVRSLTLSAPRGRDIDDVWTVHAVVCYLIFDPPKLPR